jgi:hypothetical protein
MEEYKHKGTNGKYLGVDAKKVTDAFNKRFQQNREPEAIRKLISLKRLSMSISSEN